MNHYRKIEHMYKQNFYRFIFHYTNINTNDQQILINIKFLKNFCSYCYAFSYKHFYLIIDFNYINCIINAKHIFFLYKKFLIIVSMSVLEGKCIYQ